ncbi:TFIIB-type zinc finger domain-containing protein [Candidatus Saccharibacteria bacterium]|nr:TFIIB-type zinc finger domain-containing protein [Candidatus Saccharibacteria bacterium]
MSQKSDVEQKSCSAKNRSGVSKNSNFSDFEKLLERLKTDFKEYYFKAGKRFAFKPPKTIVVGPDEPRADLLLLHELGHATLGHKDFKIDATRLKMESEAWEKAHELADIYGVNYDEDLAQSELDTYRDWLHKKSRCPDCGLTRFQDSDGVYHCPRCENFT